jgi:hypothetical protein
LPSNSSGGSNNNSVRQPSLGQLMPPIAEIHHVSQRRHAQLAMQLLSELQPDRVQQ